MARRTPRSLALIVTLATSLALGVAMLGVTPAQAAVAAGLVRTINTAAWSPSSPDPSGIVYHPGTGRLLVVDRTKGCSPTTYCPLVQITREQMAAFIHRAFR